MPHEIQRRGQWPPSSCSTWWRGRSQPPTMATRNITEFGGNCWRLLCFLAVGAMEKPLRLCVYSGTGVFSFSTFWLDFFPCWSWNFLSWLFDAVSTCSSFVTGCRPLIHFSLISFWKSHHFLVVMFTVISLADWCSGVEFIHKSTIAFQLISPNSPISAISASFSANFQAIFLSISIESFLLRQFQPFLVDFWLIWPIFLEFQFIYNNLSNLSANFSQFQPFLVDF